MEFVQLREDEYESFVSSHALGSFSQSSANGRRFEFAGWSKHLVGVRDNKGTVVAAAMLTSKIAFRRMSVFEAAQGPIMDYDDEPLVKFFFNHLHRFLRRQNAVRLRISPPVAMQHRDVNSNLINDGYDGNKYIRLLKNVGFTHLDNQTVDADPQLSRWYAAKDMSQYQTAADLIKSFDLQTRWSIRRALQLGVTVKSLSIDSIDEFYHVLEHQSGKSTVKRSKKYYRNLAKAYGDNVQFCVAQLDLARYEALVTQQLVDATAIVADINPRTRSKPKMQQLRTAKKTISLCNVKLAAVNKLRQDGDDIATLAAAVFIQHGNELVYFGGKSYEKYVSFGASYVLQWYGQLYAVENNIARYNFSVTKGIFSGNPEQQGAYRFKKGFGAVVEERIGYFEMYPYAKISNRLVLGRSAHMTERSRDRSAQRPAERPLVLAPLSAA